LKIINKFENKILKENNTMLLTEKYGEILESAKFAPLSHADKNTMALMLENTEKEYDRLMSEGSTSSDIAQFTPILMPLVRRVMPNLIANELLGVQPMTMPSGFMYSLVNRYTGNGEVTGGINTAAGEYGVIVKLAGSAAASVVAGDVFEGATSGTEGVVLYVENNEKGLLALVKVTTPVASSEFGLEVVKLNVSVAAIYTNEAAFRTILKGYTGSHTTAAGELLGKDMKEVGFTIAKKVIEAKTRKLKGQYTLEMYQDLKAQHGLLADEELMSLIGYELQAEMDREVVSFVNANATQVSNSFAFTTSGTDGTGRFQVEKFRTQAIKIATEARQIGLDIKRGQGNVLVVSPKVATMLEQVGTYVGSVSNVNVPVSGGVAGIFDGKYKVIVDQYAVSDYATVLYKGADRRDGMGVFAPYVPLSFQKVTNVDSGQPAIIASTRYGIETTPLDAHLYARSFGISFANTVLA
jgi:hypothetical protein